MSLLILGLGQTTFFFRVFQFFKAIVGSFWHMAYGVMFPRVNLQS